MMPVTRLFAANSARDLQFSAAMTQLHQTSGSPNDTDQLTKLLELELAQKRATWKQTGDRAKSVRAAGFVFLFLLIVACLAGGYFVFMRVSAQRANPPPPSGVHP
jgi:hypothetical protein